MEVMNKPSTEMVMRLKVLPVTSDAAFIRGHHPLPTAHGAGWSEILKRLF